MVEQKGIKLSLESPEYELVEFEEVGYHNTPSRCYVNDWINVSVSGADEIKGINIWEKSISELKIEGIVRVEIGFGDVNVWIKHGKYTSAKGVLADLGKVLDLRLGKYNRRFIEESGEYSIRII